jgi:hypothetical protein
MKSILAQPPKLILCLALRIPVVAFAGRQPTAPSQTSADVLRTASSRERSSNPQELAAAGRPCRFHSFFGQWVTTNIVLSNYRYRIEKNP